MNWIEVLGSLERLQTDAVDTAWRFHAASMPMQTQSQHENKLILRRPV